MISVRSVSKSFGKTPVLDGMDLEVGAGRIFGLLGPNGAGKTTLLKLLSCLILPDGGEAFLDGLSISQDASSIREMIGLVPQEIAMYSKLTVEENLMLMGVLHGLGRQACGKSAQILLERVRLGDSAGLRTEHCSTGMRQALNIAMGLIHGPEIILLDEPTEGLDPAVRRSVWELFQELAGEGKTILVTTHITNEAERYCDQVAFLHAGKIRAVGTPGEVRDALKPGLGAERQASFEEVFVELTEDGDGHDGL